MPQVPTSQGPSIREAAIPSAYQATPDVTAPQRALAQGLDVAGGVADRIATRESERKAYDAQAAIQASYLDAQQGWTAHRVGANAEGLVNDVDKWWGDTAKSMGDGLDPMSRALVSRQLQTMRMQSMQTMGAFQQHQLETAADASFVAVKSGIKSVAAANPTVFHVGIDENGNPVQKTGVDLAIADLHEKNAQYAARKGLTDPATLAAMNLADTTELHTQVLQGLERAAPDAARVYYEKYKTQINGEQHAEIEHQLDTVGNLAKAQAVGATLAQQFDYMHTGDAQKAIDAMDVSPEQKNAIRQEVEHRHSVQQSDSDKLQADLVGKVHTSIYSGMSKAAIMASPEFQALRDKGAMLKAIDDKGYSDTLRANANDARQLSALQRQETKLHIQSSAAAFAYSDPTVLAATPREKIAAQLPTLGQAWTEYLLQKKDSLVKSDSKLREAKIDQDDFNQVADAAGLHPLAAKTEDEKKTLMEVKAQTEQVIGAWQAANGNKEMPRDQKQAVMRKALATSVTVSGTLWDSHTNLFQVEPGDLKNVAVPELDRGQIITRLRQVRKDPAYKPTNEEIAGAYLARQKRALIDGQ